MMNFNKFHDPRENRKLLSEITGKNLDIAKVITETQQLFQQCLKKEPAPQFNKPSTTVPFSRKIKEGLFRLFAKPYSILDPTQIYVDAEGNVYPEWKRKLDDEYKTYWLALLRRYILKIMAGLGMELQITPPHLKKLLGMGV
jgi:hypothetical protein